MRKLKKVLALSLALAMGLSLVACGGSDTADTATDTTEETVESTDDGSDETDATDATDDGSDTSSDSSAFAAPDASGWDESKKIYAYSWDDDFSKKLGVVLDKYPEYKDYVEFVTLGVGGQSDEYKTGIDTALESGDKYPSLIPADIGVAKYWSEDDNKTLNLYDIGITDDMLSGTYGYVKDFGSFNGELKCLTWQATPGSVFYRRDIATEVFGTDDPAEVQAKLADWETFFATAAELNEKGYKIVSGPADIKYPIWESKTNPWVTEDGGTEKLTLDASVTDYFEKAKKLADEGLTNNAEGMWQSSWYADMATDAKVFCYFGCPWFIGTMKDNGAEDGKWGAVVGPGSYHWGGTYVSVGKDTPNPELCAFLLYELACDPDVGYEITKQYGDMTCTKAANEKVVADGIGASDFLGGQDPFEVWAEAAEGINLANETYQDGTLQGYMDEASTGYNSGTYSSVDEALQYVKDKANTELGISE